MRAVLDTVVFVRALINPKSNCGRLLFDLADNYVIVLSPAIIAEIISVLYRPSLRQRFRQIADLPQLDRVLALFEQAEVVGSEQDVSVCRDPNDDKFFACAVAGRAQYIVSEDKDILAVSEYEGVRTITAADFIALLQR